MIRIAILGSGNGTNAQAIIDACKQSELHGQAEVVVVISDKVCAYILERARQEGIEAIPFTLKSFASRKDYMHELKELLIRLKVDVICCAGFMLILSAEVVAAFRGRILNIHPSLLPHFPGKDPQAQALAAGAKVTGCTIHYVDEGVDTGPVILQASVPIEDDDDVDTLSKRIQKEEHRLYPLALQQVIQEITSRQ